MSIFSKDPIVLIGPGSEWFWTAVSGIVLAVTFFAIWRQLRQARSAAAFEQLNRITEEWQSERFLRAKLRVVRAIRSGETPPHGPVVVISDYWEKVASLVRAGHVDARVVYGFLGPSLRVWWSLLQDENRRIRQDQDPTVYVHFEWLSGVFDELIADHGVPASIDRAASVADLTPEAIASYEDQIRMAEESRMVPQRVVRPRRRSADAATAAGAS